jgi:hypothetical protein
VGKFLLLLPTQEVFPTILHGFRVSALHGIIHEVGPDPFLLLGSLKVIAPLFASGGVAFHEFEPPHLHRIPFPFEHIEPDQLHTLGGGVRKPLAYSGDHPRC